MLKIRFRSLDPNYSDVEIDLGDEPLTLGRSVAADVQLPHPHVSRLHCQLERRGENASIRDLQSTNGIFVNGLQTNGAELVSGDRLLIGGFDLRVFVVHESAPVANAPVGETLESLQTAV